MHTLGDPHPPAAVPHRAQPSLDQRDVIAWLETPAAYGATTETVERIDTHSSVVFLVGDRAYKLKRAVRYDYLDYSTPARRRKNCVEEVVLNRRTAPMLYRGIRAVSRAPDGSLSLDGWGRAVDWLVEMTRFDQDTQLDRLAQRGTLDLELMPRLADAVAHFHDLAEWRVDQGGLEAMAAVLRGNRDGLLEHGRGVLDATACQRLSSESFEMLERQTHLLEARRQAGFVRHCHGDLHLRNVCLLDGAPTLFDCVEFNPAIACIDVAYDLAFLLMDLLHRGLDRHANEVLNQYVERTGDLGGLALLPLFLSARAAVRAKTSATAISLLPHADDRVGLRIEARPRQPAPVVFDSHVTRVVPHGGDDREWPIETGYRRHIQAAVRAVPGRVTRRATVGKDLRPTRRRAARVSRYMAKVVRETKERTSWLHPNEPYEAAAAGFVRETLDWSAAPGVPDLYQGTELWDFGLVDPDNRRPVSFDRRAAILASLAPSPHSGAAGADLKQAAGRLLTRARDGVIKLFETARGLANRRSRSCTGGGRPRPRTPGDRVDRRAVAPETTAPLETSELRPLHQSGCCALPACFTLGLRCQRVRCTPRPRAGAASSSTNGAVRGRGPARPRAGPDSPARTRRRVWRRC